MIAGHHDNRIIKFAAFFQQSYRPGAITIKHLHLKIVIGYVRADIFGFGIKIRYLNLIDRYADPAAAALFIRAMGIVCTKPETKRLIALTLVQKLLETSVGMFTGRMFIDIAASPEIARTPTLTPIPHIITSIFQQ